MFGLDIPKNAVLIQHGGVVRKHFANGEILRQNTKCAIDRIIKRLFYSVRREQRTKRLRTRVLCNEKHVVIEKRSKWKYSARKRAKYSPATPCADCKRHGVSVHLAWQKRKSVGTQQSFFAGKNNHSCVLVAFTAARAAKLAAIGRNRGKGADF